MNALQSQLNQYAEDFQDLLGRHLALVERHDALKAMHARCTDAGAVLAHVNPSFQEVCLVINAQGDILQMTDSARSVLELSGTAPNTIQRIIAPFHLSHLQVMLQQIASGNTELLSAATEFFMYPAADAAKARLFSARFVCFSQDNEARVCWIMRDLTAVARGDIDADHQFKCIQNLHQGALVHDLLGHVLAADSTFLEYGGYGSNEVLRQMPAMLNSHQASEALGAEFWHALQGKGHWRGDVNHTTQDQQALPQWMSIAALKSHTGETVAYVAVLANRQLMLGAELAILNIAHHDPHTGLPNMDLFQDQVSKRIALAWRGGPRVIVLTIVLDRLQWLRDTQDAGVAEAVVLTMSARLQEVIRGCDCLAQSEADRFAVALSAPRNAADLTLITSRMIKALAAPLLVGKQKLMVGGSIGCAQFPQDGVDAAALLRHAESAMQAAQLDGGNRFRMHPKKGLPHTARPGNSADPETATRLAG